MDKNCVFCRIIAGEIPGHRVWEDDGYLAVLDLYPIRRGQTLVITKRHMGSYVFGLGDEEAAGLFLAAKKVAGLLDKGLGAQRTVQVMEGLGVGHAHLKLYPVIEGEYEGGLVPVGNKADDKQLAETAVKIREGGVK